jgi:hypothetical protein
VRGYELNRRAVAVLLGVLVVAAVVGWLLGHLLISLVCAAGLIALILAGEATSAAGRAEHDQVTRFHGRR